MMTDGAAKEKMKDGCSWQEGRGEWEEEIRWGEEKRGKLWILFIFYFFFLIERAEQLDTYLYFIFDWNIFFLTILCIFLRWNVKVLRVFFGRDMLNK